jgi:hypothetical protein
MSCDSPQPSMPRKVKKIWRAVFHKAKEGGEPDKSKSKPDLKPRPKAPKLGLNECVVCLESEQCLTSRRCNHPICVNCLGDYINITHNSRMPCPCPSFVTCGQYFMIDDLTPFLEVEQVNKIWLQQAAIHVEKGAGMFCPNSKCSKPVLFSHAVQKKAKTGICRSCHSAICIPCKSAFHTNLSCKQYQALPPTERNILDLQLFELAAESQWVRCPGCKQMVEREEGCFYMRCMCGTAFCYECSKKLTASKHTCRNARVLVHEHYAYEG